MKQFTSIAEVKAVAEKFEAGRIVPKRILKGGTKERKVSHHLKFYRNVYRLQGVDCNNVLVCDFDEFYGKNHALELTGKYNGLTFKGNPYSNGCNLLIGNSTISNDEFLVNINNAVFGKVAGEV